MGQADGADLDPAVVVERNREQQAAVYGEPLAALLGRVVEQLGLTQARIAGILGLSAPMISQLISARRVKIGNPVAVQRLQSLAELASRVSAGHVPMAEVESRLAEIGAQSAVVSRSTTGGALPPRAGARAVQAVFRAVASAEDLLDAASMVKDKYPEIAMMLRVYGAGRTGDAVAHFETNVEPF